MGNIETDNLIQRTIDLSQRVNRVNGSINEFLIISDFGTSSIGSYEGFVKPYFRIFEPVKAEKGRKLSKQYDTTFNALKDSLMDYPTIAAYKLGVNEETDWKRYNRLISVHIAKCPINCWHCYLEECLRNDCNDCTVSEYCIDHRKSEYNIKTAWYSAQTIVNDFVLQRESDSKIGVQTNILRITGGEPFLAPKLIIDILDELRRRELDKEILIWTETNLMPFCVSQDGKTIVSDELLNKLSQYNNLCIHPCFHGLSIDSFQEITGCNINNFDVILIAFTRLFNAGLDIYPTFGSNVTPLEEVVNIYKKISSINYQLPLRFCLIEYDLDYNPVKWRNKNINGFSKAHEKVFDRFQIISKWDELLRKHTGFGYGERPRHLIKMDRGATMTTDNKIIHLFKWPSMPQYQKLLLQTLSIPIGARGILRYREKYVNNSFINEIESINKGNSLTAVFWTLSCKQVINEGSRKIEFDFAYPVRYLDIRSVSEHEGEYHLEYLAREFIEVDSNISNIDALRGLVNIDFGRLEYPYPGTEKGFVYVGPLVEFKKSLTIPKLVDMYNRLKGISALVEPKQKSELKEFPFFRINSIKDNKGNGCKVNNDGKYIIYDNNKYYLEFSTYQPEEYRNKDRDIYVHGKRLHGVQITDRVALRNIDESDDEIVIDVKTGDLDYIIPIKIRKKKTLAERKFTPLATLVILVAIAIFMFFKFVDFSQNPGEKNRIMFTFLTPLIILVLNKGIELLQKK